MAETDAEAGDGGVEFDPDVLEDREQWEALGREEQSQILGEGLDRLKGNSGSGHWRHLSARAQAETRQAIEGGRAGGTGHYTDVEDLSPAEAAMQEALEQTWTAELFAHSDDITTVPLTCRELSDQEQDIMTDGFGLMAALDEQAGEVEDLDEVTFDSEFFDSIEQFERWLFAFLADVVQEASFDEERFRTGAGLRSGTRQELLSTIFFRYQEEAERAQKFRQE